MKILVTNFDRSGENVMLMGATLIDAEDMAVYFRMRELPSGGLTEVPQREMQYYPHDPFWLTVQHRHHVLAAIAKT